MENNSIDFESKDAVKRAFEFLLEKSHSPEPFTKEEFEIFANYPNPDNFVTYFSKKFKHLLEEAVNDEGYLVSGIFKNYATWEKFYAFYSQSTKIKADYNEQFYCKLMTFEFYLPLTNEKVLRSTLDDLFYKDKLKLMFNKILKQELYAIFPKNPNESNVDYIERLCKWCSDKFVGYSIQTVNGRFKTDELKTFTEVGEMSSKGYQYIIDETTAIVRFIFPIGTPLESNDFFNKNHLEKYEELESEDFENDLEVKQIRFFFKNLFVKSILEMVNGEDEIWMVESGIKTLLYIWRKSK